MHNGLAAFVDDGKYGFLEKTGQEKIKPQFDWASQFSEGLCAVRNDEGLYGYIDTSGILVIPCLFQRAYDFLRGKASIELNNTKGTIDKTGKLITPHDQNDVTS
jgi:hypothetical protein